MGRKIILIFSHLLFHSLKVTLSTKAILVSSLFSGSSITIPFLSNLVTTLVMIPLIMDHCSEVIPSIHKRLSISFFPKVPLQLICYYLLIKFIAILIGKFFWNVKLDSFPSVNPQCLKTAKTLDEAADSLNYLSWLLRYFRKPAHMFIVERTANTMSFSQFPGSSLVHHCPITSQKFKKKKISQEGEIIATSSFKKFRTVQL